jgi:RHS repeat-associated protein
LVGSPAWGYFPHGEEYTTTTGDTDKFAKYYSDNDTGLDYARNRSYSSILGRFLTPDPYTRSVDLTNPGTINRYTYVNGDPVHKNDPSDRDPCDPDTEDCSGLLIACGFGWGTVCGLPPRGGCGDPSGNRFASGGGDVAFRTARVDSAVRTLSRHQTGDIKDKQVSLSLSERLSECVSTE